jgi:hypothetical protein
MAQHDSKTLTQDEAVAELHKRGYTDVNKRRLASWRANDLLQPFDVVGGGRGRQRGRQSNAWLDGDEVLSQAAQICELLKMYKSFDDLYLPLWMLGYSIPLRRVREALSRPLDETVSGIKVEPDGRTNVEDEIDDAVDECSEIFQHEPMKLFELPQATLAAGINLLLNSDYKLDDQQFEDGVGALQGWDKELQQRCAEIFGEEIANSISLAKPTSEIWTVFMNAPFIKEHLSLRHIKQAVDECSDEDLTAVQRDLQVLREIVFEFKRMLMLFFPYIPEELKSFSANEMASIFMVGKMIIWADLSLRRSGYGVLIDHILPMMLSEIQTAFNKELEKELSEFGPQLTVAIETLFDKLGVPLSGREGLSP